MIPFPYIKPKRVIGSVLLIGGAIYLPAAFAETPRPVQIAMVPTAGAPTADPRLTPQAPPPMAGGSMVQGPAPKLPAGPKQEDHVILPNLKGLVFIDNVKALRKSGTTGKGIVTQNLPMLEDPAIRDQLAAFIGKPLTQESVKDLVG